MKTVKETSIAAYTGTSVFKKSNNQIMSWSSAPLFTNKLFAVGTMQAKQQKNGSFIAIIPGSILKRIMKNNSGSFYDRVRDACVNRNNMSDPNTLINFKNYFEDEDTHEFLVQNMITDAGFRDGTLYIAFNPQAAKYIFDLQSRYTSLDADEMLSLENNHAWRMYEMFQQQIGFSQYMAQKRNGDLVYPYSVTYGLTRLKLALGIIDINNPEVFALVKKKGQLGQIRNDDFYLGYYDEEVEKYSEKSYLRFNNFRMNVLDKAEKELEKKTSLRFTYEKTYKNHSVSHLTFYIYDRNFEEDQQRVTAKKEPEAIDVLDLLDQARTIIKEELPSKDILAVLKAADYDLQKVEDAYAYASDYPTPITNLAGFLIKAIQNNYKKSGKQNRSVFTDISQNNDDYSEFIRRVGQDV